MEIKALKKIKENKKMKILLISCYELGNQPIPTASLHAFLKSYSYNPQVLDLSTQKINHEDIQNSTYSNVKDILEIAMPNVQMVASNHSDDRVKIQGLDNKYLTFLVDGDRVSGEYAGNIDFSMFNLSNVDKIEVVEGAMSTLYGSSAIGGVVNILTKKHKDPFWINLSIP